MVHYFFVERWRFINFTGFDITVYSQGGSFVKLENANFRTPLDGDFYYITDEREYDKLIKAGVREDRLLRAYHTGIGRYGIMVSFLYLYNNRNVRVMPSGE